MRQLLILFIFALSACSATKQSGDTSNKKFLLPWADENGQYTLQEIQLDTLDSNEQVSGRAARVYVRPTFSDSGITGEPARPQLTKAGNVMVPLDAESGMALTVYGYMERIYKFEKRNFGPTTLSWPRDVIVNLKMESVGGSELHNNAGYYAEFDAIGIFPYSRQGKNSVPMAVNPGILAHEHFHAHFQKSVWSPVLKQNEMNPNQMHPVKTMDFKTARDYNIMVLRAWTEGLADFYASVFTGNSDPMRESLTFDPLDNRDLEGEFTSIKSVAAFRSDLLNSKLCVEAKQEDCALTESYRLGTQIARALYQVGGEHRLELLKHIIKTLPALGEQLSADLSTRSITPAEVIGRLLDNWDLASEKCEKLEEVLPPTIMNERFSECSEQQ